jgi:glycosyltransferase involved in cell wall biosynthesis
MAVSDVVVSCSTDPEAFGRVTLEALALGKPVAGYAHGGVGEQLKALLPEGNIPVGDKKTIVKLLTNWANAPTHPVRESTFTLESMLSSTLDIYKDLAAPRT